MSRKNGISQESSNGSAWWKSLSTDIECAITLEPLCTLPYPPFELTSSGKKGAASYLFDGLALATYCIARGIFQNPLTRQDLNREDCARLDAYLDQHCTRPTGSREKFSVLEAFCLHEKVNVQETRGSSSDVQRERAVLLRNTATAALAGLFVYGNQNRLSRRAAAQETNRSHASNHTANQDDDMLSLTIATWGLDLSRAPPNDSNHSQQGYAVIDDDEAIVESSQQSAYDTLQCAFPHLPNDSAARSSHLEPSTSHAHLLPSLQSADQKEREEKDRREQQIRINQYRMFANALKRCADRRQRRADERAQYLEQKKIEAEETMMLQQARDEIEIWQESRWEQMRLLADEKNKSLIDSTAEKVEKSEQKQTEAGTDDTPIPNKTEQQNIDKEAEINAVKKDKAAAKRKRARERKRLQAAERRAKEETEARQAAIEAKKAASDRRCAACHQGLLPDDYGFERFGSIFCSPKCARSGSVPR